MTPRAERSDARRNRERLLDAAEAHFSEKGIDASLNALAERAGLGIGTLYRHFPTHADLIRGLYDRLVDRLDEVRAECEEAETGWEAIERFVDGSLRVMGAVPAAGAIMHRQAAYDPAYRPGTRWEEPLRAIVRTAQEEGALRADVVPTDIAVIPFVLDAARQFPEPMGSLALARQRALLLSGLRADPDRAIPLAGAALSVDEYHAAVHRS